MIGSLKTGIFIRPPCTSSYINSKQIILINVILWFCRLAFLLYPLLVNVKNYTSHISE
uniref:Uncharacterized protein n=1 Tax=Anguilla anguilla TaxID=7936 RepID=A0A0E9S985_ANGAN